jgi:hypothetical protein
MGRLAEGVAIVDGADMGVSRLLAAQVTAAHQLTKANLIDRAINRIDGTIRFSQRADVLDAAGF